MTSSSVTLGPQSATSEYSGTVSSLNGTDVAAQVSGNGKRLAVVARLQFNPDSGTAAGTVSVTP
jgi:hypothetical protein